MTRIKVLVVDDSVLARKLVSDALSEDPDIEVYAVAANGKIALQKILQSCPDVVTLDVEMPEMDGIETVRQIRKTHPKLPIIMFSAHTERGATETLEALAAGATDYVTKPTGSEGAAQTKERIRNELAAKIKAFVPRSDSGLAKKTNTTALSNPIKPRGAFATIRIVAIGVSTGGPNALAEVLPQIPNDFRVPIVLVQHMPPVFTRLLAERLTAKSKIPVHEAIEAQRLEPGQAYLAPGDFHMEVRRRNGCEVLHLHQGQQENSCRPAVDPLFRSVSSIYGAGVLAVILTGMGQDGLQGCRAVHAAGGQIIAQDENSSVVWGMPGYVAQAGLAEKVLPLSEISSEIIRRTTQKGV